MTIFLFLLLLLYGTIDFEEEVESVESDTSISINAESSLGDHALGGCQREWQVGRIPPIVSK
jgi:hypothetical protein